MCYFHSKFQNNVAWIRPFLYPPFMLENNYDLFSPTFKANPFPTYAQMRTEDPIHAHLAPNGTTIWYITRYADVVNVLKDDEHFCKDPANARDTGDNQRKKQRSAMQRLINENMLFSDPPHHTRLRALVNQAFTPRRIAQLTGRIQAICDQLLEEVMPYKQMDLITAYALPLPVMVICELLGIPAADQTEVSDWSQAIISPGSKNLTYRQRKQKIRAFTEYLQDMFAARRIQPQDDLVTALVQAEEAGDKLNEAELSSMVALLLVTGHETTVNLIGNGVLALLQNPDQLAIVQNNPDLWETAVEELLRFDGPVETSTTRWVRKNIQIEGHTLKRGDVVRVVLSSANRDETQISCPAELNIQRDDNKHLAFGLGIHYCLGAPLARLEGCIAFPTLFKSFPTLHLVEPDSLLSWRSGILFRGLKRLPVSW